MEENMNQLPKIVKCFSLLLALAFLSSFAFVSAQEKKELPKKETAKQVAPKAEEKEELPVKKQYEQALKHYKEWSDKFDNEDYWKSVTLTRVSDKKEFKVKDLPEFDKNGFYLNNLRRCTFEMKRLDGFWGEELKTYTKTPPKQEGVPTTDDLKKYIQDLTTLRKSTAVKLEAFAEKFVKQYPDKFTKEEGEQLLKTIRELHDENKLIERKK
jgi:hypothetical protein